MSAPEPAVAPAGKRAAPFVVAIDGPAGSGKSSVAKAVARRLGFDYLDSGAAYRAFGWLVLEAGIDPADGASVIAGLEAFDYQIGIDPDDYFVRVGQEPVTEAIREPRISAAASATAQLPPVRAHMVALFRRIIAGSTAPGIVVEGRDITTVVAPEAPVRLLLTASEEVRAARRAGELGAAAGVAQVAAAIAARDAADSRMVNFTSATDGVVTLDTSALGFEQVVAAVLELVQGRLAG